MRASTARRAAAAAAASYDAIVVGGGHNGLVAAAYLARAGKRVVVLERRHLLGGAAVTEELHPGFRYSRASYVYSLFRPQIVADLDLHRHGLRLIPRVPSSFTPQEDPRAPSLLLGGGAEADAASIAQFSRRDAAAWPAYNAMLERYAAAFRPLLDRAPPDWAALGRGPAPGQRAADWWREWRANAGDAAALARALGALGASDAPGLLNFLLSPATKTLDAWFESDVLKATLATDAVIGSWAAPSTPQSSYVLLHHVMCGTWANVVGGMGALSDAIARAGAEAGVEHRTRTDVARVLLEHDAPGLAAAGGGGGGDSDAPPPAGRVVGVELADGTVLRAPVVVANAAPAVLFGRLLAHAPELALPRGLAAAVARGVAPSGCVKINVALSALPSFACRPNDAPPYELPAGAAQYGPDGSRPDLPRHLRPLPHHRGTVHFETSVAQLEEAYASSLSGRPSGRPIVELTLPSALDATLAPPGQHVALLFCQYAPYELEGGRPWGEPDRAAFAEAAFAVVERHAPGFRASVLHADVLAPPDLEALLALPRGNIFHAPMGLDALLWERPAPGAARYRVPRVGGLYMASAGTHPGGGVIGAPGRNAAAAVLADRPQRA
jgi:phytoene dehydrogenase-like protein